MEKADIILVGGGGHCKSCIDVIEHEGKYNIFGIIDIESRVGEKLMGYSILGSDKDIPSLLTACNNFVITLGQIQSSEKRISIYNKIKLAGGNFPIIISPTAYVSEYSFIGEGTIVMHHALVNAGVNIGVNCIINTKSLLEHDVKIGDHCHISTAANINGDVKVGSNCTIGSNATIIQSLELCDNVIVGAGSVVIRDINVSGTYVGTPVK